MKREDEQIKYPDDQKVDTSCRNGSIFYNFQENGNFKLTVEADNCCPGVTGGVYIQHPSDRPGGGTQKKIDKDEEYETTFEAEKGEKVHIWCSDIISAPHSCIFEYTIKKL